MNIFTLSFLLTSAAITVFMLLALIAGMNPIEHWQWVGNGAKGYYILCFLVAWYAAYNGLKSKKDYENMINSVDEKYEEWKRNNP